MSESFLCCRCNKRFSKKILWRIHFKRMHSGAHKCQNCELSFDTYLELRRHFADVHPKLKHCSQCEYSHKFKYQVQRHELQAHGQRSVACSFENCSQLLPFSKLKRHIREKHLSECKIQNNNNSCTVSNNYSNKSLNDEKLASANFRAQKLFDDAIGSYPKNFKQLKSVSIDSNFQCTICGVQRSSRILLKRHIARVHEKRYVEKKREKKFVCQEPGCNKSFCYPTLLEDHLNRHRGVFPYECPRCNRKYSARANYARHLHNYHGTSIKNIEQPLVHLDIFKQTEVENT